MKTERFEFTGWKGVKIPGVCWTPEGECRAVLQIAHGMTEHAGRYETLAQWMTQRGIAVAAFDLRGHGQHPGNFGTASCGEGGWEASIEDMHIFFQMLEEKFPEIPHYHLGFSLGSFLLREYLERYAQGAAGAVLVGTGHEPGWLLSVMVGIVNAQVKKAGFDGTTDLVRKLSFETYNQTFNTSP